MFIYVMTCVVNGKHYVGYDTGPEENMRRYSLHVSSAINKTPPKHRSKLYPAMVKYGPDKFTVKIVAKTNDFTELKNLEIEWIKKLDSIKNGYNIRPGGNGFAPLSSLSEEEALIQRNAMKRGAKRANEVRWAGKTLDERRDILSKAHASYSSKARSKNLKTLWDNMTPEQKQERSQKMKDGWARRKEMLK